MVHSGDLAWGADLSAVQTTFRHAAHLRAPERLALATANDLLSKVC